uniref:Protein LMBR1L n=1 Tax=Aceria tosichella TaxID=561515 RepID=A0A6G1SM78_9ACAR
MALSSSDHSHHQSHHYHQHDNKPYSLFFVDDELPDSELQGEKGKEFYTYMRTHVIYLVTIIILYALSNSLISYFSKRNDIFRNDIEEYRTYKISTWMCAFTLAISIAAFLLLPASITTNEMTWIDDTQTKWSLLDGMWSYVFLFSNLSLFVLLPFAYFFTESEGFPGSRPGMLSRLRETCVLLILVAIIVLGLTYTIFCLFFGIGCHVSGIRILTIWQYLPFLYSCISFIGALLLLLCTPLGISHLFTVLKQMDTIQRTRKFNYTAMLLLVTLAGYSVILVLINTIQLLAGFRSLPLSTALSLAQQRNQATFESQDDLSLDQVIEQQKEANLLMREKKNGPIGAFLEIVMILYLWCASLCGLYNLPKLCHLRPYKHMCSFNQIIGNCAILCLLSSALPLLARTLGMTNFDLLSDFGRIEWLGNFYVVLLYNLVFLVSTIVSLIR